MDHKPAIREATPADQDKVSELFKEMLEYHELNDPIFQLNPDGHLNYGKWFCENIANESALALVAECDKDIVGFCLSLMRKYPLNWVKEDYGEINDLAVSEAHRNKGIGQALVNNSIKWFKSKGIDRIEVKVATTNPISSKFYRKLGFSPYMENLFLEI